MFLELSNCAIRSLRLPDAPAIANELNNRNVWSTLTDRIPFPYTPSDAEQFIERSLAATPVTNFAITIDDEPVGVAGYCLQTGDNRCWAEIGYWLGEAYWGRGIATEVLRALTEYAFKNHELARIEAMVNDGNVASMRVLDKCGYIREGMLRGSCVKDGKIIDQALYAIVRDDLGVTARITSECKATVRPAVPKDAANIAALSIEVWLHTYATEGVGEAISEYVLREFTPQNMLRDIEHPLRMLLVAENDDLLLGYSLLHFDAPCPSVPRLKVELDKLYVQEHFHGRGIGHSLLHASLELARGRNSDGLWLKVYRGNAKAIGFYVKEGFNRVGTTYFELGGEQHENHVLALV